jgi:subtilisin family serine protease
MRPRPHRLVTAIATLALLLGAAAPVGADEEPELPRVGTDALARDSWIVTLEDGADPAAVAPGLSRAAGGRAGLVYRHALNGFQFVGSRRAAAALERNPRVVSVQADAPLYLTAETLPFGVKRASAYVPGGDGAYQEGFRGNGARIAVLDTGIDLDHPDLVANLDADLGYNCVDGGQPPEDVYGHGSHVAGTAAAPVNGSGVVGVAPEARLVPLKMFTDAGDSSEAFALCALDHVVGLNQDADADNDVHVVNMSWGESRSWGSCESDALHGAICAAADAGIILVAGAGNSAANARTFVPAAYPEVISVSALADFDGEPGGTAGCGLVPSLGWFECDDTFAFFSNYGTSVELVAPGVNVQSTVPGGGLAVNSGTSMAAPHVAGVAALIAAAAPGVSATDARAAMAASGECPDGDAAGADGVDGCDGQGTWPDDPDGIAEPMVHALRAVQAATAEPEAPSAPTLISATPGDGFVELSWSTPANGGSAITGYHVYRGTSSGALSLLDSVGVVNDYLDEAVSNGTTYWYAVAAANAVGEGAQSNELSAVPQIILSAPSAPVNLKAKATAAAVVLSWQAPDTDGGSEVTAYRIYRGTSSGSLALLTEMAASETGFDDAAYPRRAWTYYAITAVNDIGEGPPSNQVKVRTR